MIVWCINRFWFFSFGRCVKGERERENQTLLKLSSGPPINVLSLEDFGNSTQLVKHNYKSIICMQRLQVYTIYISCIDQSYFYLPTQYK